MGDLRLTHGGFYRHFRGKDELFGEALAEALTEVSLRLERAALAAPESSRAQAIIDAYLSPEHLADVAGGCPVAALASDLSRAGRSLHGTAFEAAGREHIGRMANYLPGDTLDVRCREARVLFSGMAGTMAMTRALADPKRQQDVLTEARRFYRAALGV